MFNANTHALLHLEKQTPACQAEYAHVESDANNRIQHWEQEMKTVAAFAQTCVRRFNKARDVIRRYREQDVAAKAASALVSIATQSQ